RASASTSRSSSSSLSARSSSSPTRYCMPARASGAKPRRPPRGLARRTESVLIQVEHLTKCYGPVRAVDDVSFGVARGEVAALLGPNGSGKSTLIRCLIGFFSPTAGRVRVGGGDLPEP